MLEVNDRIRIPDDELQWSYVRSSGPGGQNVNKVASKAVLRWDLAGSPSVPAEVKARLQAHHRRRITGTGELVLSSQRYRDQDRNRQDCLEKLGELLREAAIAPRPRKVTRPSRGSRVRRLAAKRHRAGIKEGRRRPGEE
jgi:ribosome-associated protein